MTIKCLDLLSEETIKVSDVLEFFGVSTKDSSPRTAVLTGCMGGFSLRIVACVLVLGAKCIYVFDLDPKHNGSNTFLMLTLVWKRKRSEM